MDFPTNRKPNLVKVLSIWTLRMDLEKLKLFKKTPSKKDFIIY